MLEEYELLDYICSLINKKVNEHRLIYEKTLLDFSLTVASIIRHSFVTELPESFHTMYDALTDYWFNSVYSDEDREVANSYVRAYQIATTIETFIQDREIKKEIEISAKKYSPYKDIIKAIYDTPDKVFSFKTTGNNVLTELIIDGYVDRRMIGNYMVYNLTNKGLNLYEKIFENK